MKLTSIGLLVMAAALQVALLHSPMVEQSQANRKEGLIDRVKNLEKRPTIQSGRTDLGKLPAGETLTKRIVFPEAFPSGNVRVVANVFEGYGSEWHWGANRVEHSFANANESGFDMGVHWSGTGGVGTIVEWVAVHDR